MSDSNSPPSGGGGSVHKPICTICFEDLKPIVEDLQTLLICGHVFHELCIQQWLEYCPGGKQPTCPVCKQSCSRQNITRLYFQSTGDSTQLYSSLSPQDPANANAQALVEEVKKLEGKLAVLTLTFENQQLHLKKVDEEVPYMFALF
ncbi:RING-H2 finger protein ATL30 [Platanthera guangdongensis]|uniref:RING-H2 finger protein ATL30 n=1 Tax=Platanthera guangdongensis TaxID=2320717 RepID=A0ABR2MSA6_9ASPA